MKKKRNLLFIIVALATILVAGAITLKKTSRKMIKTEFGIIEDIGETQEYSYDSKKYQCVCIDDVYIDDWWNKLLDLRGGGFHNTA